MAQGHPALEPWPRLEDYRAVIASDYKPMVALFGPQAGAIAHLARDGAEATLCGIPRSALSPYEDLDEPLCNQCVDWHWKVIHAQQSPHGGEVRRNRPV